MLASKFGLFMSRWMILKETSSVSKKGSAPAVTMFPTKTSAGRYYRSLANAVEALRIAHEAVVYDNSGLQHQRVMQLRDGVVIWHIGQNPNGYRTSTNR